MQRHVLSTGIWGFQLMLCICLPCGFASVTRRYNQKKEHVYGTNITEILFTISILHLGSFSTYKEQKQIMFNMFNTAIFQLL